MDVVVTPPVASGERRALLVALERMGVRRTAAPHQQAWWQTGLREAVDGEDQDAGYAFSPRRTRGATRA